MDTTDRPRNRPSGRAVAGALALGLMASTLIGSLGSGASASQMREAVRSRSGRDAPLSVTAATGKVTAHDNSFFVDGKKMLFHGMGVGFPLTAEWDKIETFGFNIARSHSEWAQLEPNPPTKNSDGTWTHHYDTTYLGKIQNGIREASSHGMYLIINNGVCFEDTEDKPACSPAGWPQWLFKAQYNSHGTTYDLTNSDQQAQALADFWTDDLMVAHMRAMWAYLVNSIKGIPGLAGYEIMNEPQKGNLLPEHSTTQLMLDVQARLGQTIRSNDPNHVIFFATRSGYGAGLPGADLSGMAALGNVAFDVHDYFGARWGRGLNQSPTNPAEGRQNQYDSTLSTAPYFGTTLSQIRFCQTYMNALSPYGIPLLVGEFGDYNVDPGVMNYFGTATSAFNQLGLSWNVNNSLYGDRSLLYADGSPTPWLTQIIKPAAAYKG